MCTHGGRQRGGYEQPEHGSGERDVDSAVALHFDPPGATDVFTLNTQKWSRCRVNATEDQQRSVRVLPGKQLQRVRHDVEHRVEALDGAARRARGVEDERGSDGARDTT
jgi:hypothetical protein